MNLPKRTSIAVILPSRGLIFAQTLSDLQRELKGIKHHIFYSIGNKIPDCFNKPLEQALRGSYSHVWFVEEDMVFYDGVLKDLLKANKPAVSCDYPVTPGEPSGSVLYASKDTGYFSGTGCLLVKRSVFDNWKLPIFRSDIVWLVRPGTFGIEFTADNTDVLPDKQPYGLHDITFGLQMYMHGKPIHILPKPLSQLRIAERGKSNTNSGVHTITALDNHGRIDFSANFSPFTFSKDELLKEVYIDGDAVMVSPEMEKKLLKSGRGERRTLVGDKIRIDLQKRPELVELFT